MDAMLHVKPFGESHFAYPVGLDKVLFRADSLPNASKWICRLQDNSFGNDTVFMEGLRMEYMPVSAEKP